MGRIKAKHIIEILIHLALWLGVYYALNSLRISTYKLQVSQNGTIAERYAMDAVFPYSRFTLVFLALLFYGNVFWILKKILHYKNLSIGIAVAVGWFILTFFANYIFVSAKLSHDVPIVQKRLYVKMLDSGSKIDPNAPVPPPTSGFIQSKPVPGQLLRNNKTFFAIGNWFSTQLTMLLIFLLAAGLSIAYFFLKEWARNELVRNQMEAHQLSTEIKFLKSQINPHFLFNTLNNLFSMAQDKENDELADGISKLSGMMRYMIYESNEELVPLKKEIEYLRNCIVLNKLRYADEEANVIFEYSDKTEGIFVAPMMFIPFIENAFKHGLCIGVASQIYIFISLTGKRLIFNCENTNYSFIKKMDMEISGIGLENVKRRLELVYPGKHQLMINDEGEKFMVKLEIDLS